MNTFPPTVRTESFADGLTVRVEERGSGRPMLVLHGAGGPPSVSSFAAAMAEHAHVLVPTHPGFEGEPRPEWCTDIDDLALAYLDLLERLDLREVIVIGFSFGGWIAASLAVRDTTRLRSLILVDAEGIQVDGHEMAAVFARPPDASSAPGNPLPGAPAAVSPEPGATRSGNFQTITTVYGREGLSDPKLRRRLARVRIPALVVWGENDAIVDTDYGRAYAQSLPDAVFTLIPEAGHLPQVEQPERLLNVVREFVSRVL